MPATVIEALDPAKTSAGAADEVLYEIIDGQRVELPPMSVYASWVASLLVRQLSVFADKHPIGQPFAEMLFRLPLNGSRNRRPDLAFVTYERWPKNRPVPLTENAWDVVPDLAVEVTSPNDLADDIMQKITEYFQAGVRLVWIVYPLQRLVYVYESSSQVHGLTYTDELDGGSVLPGFRLPLVNLFQETTASS
jgi:Uma2 family endonuclease